MPSSLHNHYSPEFNLRLPKEDISTEMKISWLRLIGSTNVGIRTFYELIKIYGTACRAIESINEMAVNGGGKNKIIVPSAQEVNKEVRKAEKFGAEIILAAQEEYPDILLKIADPPPVLFAKGNLSLLGKKNKIAVVGARNASINGLSMARKMSSELSNSGFVIVSGMAKGIDAAAHQASVKNGTIGVIAGGIDNIYPKENEELFHEMYEHGLIISEYRVGQKPIPKNFPQRNRIISGLSSGTVIVEAAKRSGTLITARLSLEQGREVFAVPGSPFDLRSQGTNFLIKNGATLAETAQDVIDGLNFTDSQQLELFEDHHKSFKIHPKARIPEDSQLSQHRAKIFELITFSPVNIEELAAELNLEYSVVNFMIVELELAGKVSRLYGNKVCKII